MQGSSNVVPIKNSKTVGYRKKKNETVEMPLEPKKDPKMQDFQSQETQKPAVEQKAVGIKEFDPMIMKDWPAFTALFLGRRGTGKSVLLRDFLYKTRANYGQCHVFSTTAHLQKDLFDYVPKLNIHKGFDLDEIQRLYNEQERACSEAEETIEGKASVPILLFVFDDIISDPNVRHSPLYDSMYTLGRHIRIAMITLSQEFAGQYGIKKVCRANLDLVVSFFPTNYGDRKAAVEQYLSTTVDRKVGMELINDITLRPYTAIAMLVRKSDIDYSKYVFTYKADEKSVDNPPPFMIGNETVSAKSKDKIMSTWNAQKLGYLASKGTVAVKTNNDTEGGFRLVL